MAFGFGCLLRDPFDRLRVVEWDIDYTGCDAGCFQMKRTCKAGGPPAMLNEHETAFAFGQNGPRAFEQ